MLDGKSLADATGWGSAPQPQTLEALRLFVDLVLKWNASINIIGKSTADQIWQRHILDSVQLFRCARPEHRLWLDLGSGGGFPGLVLAIFARERFPDLRFALVESDQRKCVFLSEVSRILGLGVTVHRKRIELLVPQAADVLSARALAPLDQLCDFAEMHLKPDGLCAFLKGAGVDAEIEKAQQRWRFEVDRVQSITNSGAAMVFLRDLSRV